MINSKSFCPAKWDDLVVNLNYNYVYACCKSDPIKFVNSQDITRLLDQQKNNLLNGIQDPSCTYCWKLENQGQTSKRIRHLSEDKFKGVGEYINNPGPKTIQINLGNECNFQCTYCNPKFSSQWENDVKNKPYKIFVDKFFYSIDNKNDVSVTDSIAWLEQQGVIHQLDISGGEPLQNKNFFKIIDSISSEHLKFTTNLSCKTTTLDKILALTERYKTIQINVSLDSTKENAEFTRYGLDYNKIRNNIQYIINNAPNNIIINIHSLMTSITIRDLDNMIVLVRSIHDQRASTKWAIDFCVDPMIFSLNTLPDQFKQNILESLNQLKNESWITGIAPLVGAIEVLKFNKTLYNSMKHFLEEFSSRKGIKIPVDLNF
jgi:organic radical activating enzyme